MAEETISGPGVAPPAKESKSNGAKAQAKQATRQVRQQAEAAKQNIVDSYQELEDQYANARDQLYEMNRRTVQFVEQNPGLSILGAFGVGYVIGKLASSRWFV